MKECDCGTCMMTDDSTCVEQAYLDRLERERDALAEALRRAEWALMRISGEAGSQCPCDKHDSARRVEACNALPELRRALAAHDASRAAPAPSYGCGRPGCPGHPTEQEQCPKIQIRDCLEWKPRGGEP